MALVSTIAAVAAGIESVPLTVDLFVSPSQLIILKAAAIKSE
jgi:hypothetical protein